MKIKIKKLYFDVYNDYQMGIICKAYKKLKSGKVKKAELLFKELNPDEIAKTFVIKIVEPSKMDLNFIEKFIKVAKLLYTNDKRPMGDKYYDPMIVKYKQYREEPIVDLIVSKRTVSVDHKYPELKGNIDKANVMFDKDITKTLSVSVESFIDTLFKVSQGNPISLRMSKKADGCSTIANINNNKGVLYLSRGEDDLGSDFTHIFKNIRFNNKEECGVAFEAVMLKDNYKKYCEVRGKKFASLRSAVVSVLTSSDATKYAEFLSLIPLRTSIGISPDEMNDRFAIDTNYEYREITCVNKKEAMTQIKSYTDKVLKERDSMQYAIDGVVITCMDKYIVDTLGRKNNSNRYEIAYKFPAEEKYSYVKDIFITVGRTGLITPNVEYEKVTFNGGNHDHSTLSSYDRYKKMALRYNEEILLTYNNDVMPYVNKIKNSSHNDKLDTDIIPFPTQCNCGSELILDGANYYCDNPLCDDKIVAAYAYFYKIFGVRDMAEKKISKLKDEGIFTSFKDLLNPDYNAMNYIEGFSTKSINALKKQIDFIYYNPVDESKLASALGIAGEKTCKSILSKIRLKRILEEPECLYNTKISGIEKLKKDSFIKKSKILIDIINYFYDELAIVPCVVLDNKIKMCFSGFRDSNLKIILENLGIDVVDDVTKDTRYVVVKSLDENGEPVQTGKIKKAKKYAKLGCEIITLSQLNDIMKEIV